MELSKIEAASIQYRLGSQGETREQPTTLFFEASESDSLQKSQVLQ